MRFGLLYILNITYYLYIELVFVVVDGTPWLVCLKLELKLIKCLVWRERDSKQKPRSIIVVARFQLSSNINLLTN